MTKTIENADFWHVFVVLTTITIVIAIVTRSEFLLAKAQCLVGLCANWRGHNASKQ